MKLYFYLKNNLSDLDGGQWLRWMDHFKRVAILYEKNTNKKLYSNSFKYENFDFEWFKTCF